MIFLKKIKRNSFLRKSWALFWNFYNGFPARNMTLIGITGTTGKTTLSFFLKNLFENNQEKIGLIGTAGYYFKEQTLYHLGTGPSTTPDPSLLFSLLKRMKKEGIRKVVLEVTSFGLMYFRTYSLKFKIAILTNIDYNHHVAIHGSMEGYVKSKLSLFQSLRKDALAILPKESPYFELFKKNTRAQVISYGFDPTSDYWAKITREEKDSLEFEVFKNNQFFGPIKLKLPYKENVLNALVTIIVGEYLNVDKEKIIKAIETLETIPGRLELIEKEGIKVLIDKANTPLAFKTIINFIQKINPLRKIVVYGNFGESPLEEREKLAELALNFFDLTIITEDDPLNEPPEKGIEDFVRYAQKNNIDTSKYLSILGRKEAIFKALKEAHKGDLVAILGRGNEKMMIYKDKKVPFEDKKVVEDFFKNYESQRN
ncbi:MAG: Mur ligase family protein [Candidatus Paceibacterota bacterium]